MKNKGIYLLVCVITIAAVTIGGCGFKKAKPSGGKRGGPGMAGKDQTVTVTTAPVSETAIQNSITVNGKVKPVREAEISAKVSGKVSQIDFEIGRRVKKGDILFKLDDRDLRLDLEQAAAALKTTQTSLNSSLITAETNYLDAKRNYERLQRLYDKEIGSKQDLESAESAYRLAEDTYRSAKLAEKNGTTNAQAQLEKARLAYEIAQTQLGYTVVRAPISGIVATKDLKLGQYVGASTTVATVVDLSTLVVETNVPEASINLLKLGNQVEVSVKSISEQPFTGKIAAIAPAVDGTTLNYPVKIKLPNQGNQLKSGMFATVKIPLERVERALSVPLEALGEEDGRKYVYTVNHGIAAKKMIKTGVSDDQMIQVTEGLTGNETVVVKGLNQLKAGTKVMVGK